MSDASNTDERIKDISPLRKALIRPELGGMVGTVAVFVFFLLFAFDSGMFNAQGVMNWSVVSAQFMIIAVGACLLMIAGEFDLSVGSMIGFAGMMVAIFGVTFGWPMWLAILITFVICIAFGALNGYIVVRTGLPSFIVTLATLFILMTVVIDSIGIGIMLPVTPLLIAEVGGTTLAGAAYWGGILASGFALMQFIFSPILGNLSDRFGRRPVLLASLAVMALHYLIMAMAQTVWLLLLARILGGMAAATMAVALAYMADLVMACF